MSWSARVPLARLSSALLALVLAVAAGLLGAAPAAAHDSLTGASPADGATVTAAPEQVVLTFSAQVKDIGLTVLVTSPDGRKVGDGPARVDSVDVIAPLLPLTEPGRYTVAYRVVSSDGHPISGRTSFVLDVPAPTPTATPSESPSESPSPTAASSAPATPSADATSPAASPVASTADDASSPLPWIVGGIALVALAGGAVAVARSRST